MLGTLHDRSVHVRIKRSSHWLARTSRLVGQAAAGGLLPVDVTDAPALSVEGPRSVPSRILVVLVDGTMPGTP